jgi:tetratricopeptide (TPR) repeat protein
MGLRTKAVPLTFVCLMAFGAADFANAQPQTHGCTSGAVESDKPDVGDACTAILDDPKASVATRVDALLVRSGWHSRAGRLEEAKQDIDTGLKLAPRHAQLLQLLASWHLDSGNAQEAEEIAKRSAAIDPKLPSTFELLSRIAELKGDLRSALGHVNRAVELRPEYIFARYRRAQLLRMLNRPSDALVDTTWLISQPASDLDRAGYEWIAGTRVRLHLGSLITHAQVLKSLDRFEEAEAYYNQIVAQQKTAFTLTQRSRFLLSLPVGADQSGRLQEAMRDVKEAVGLAPRDVMVRQRYAFTLEYAQRLDEAIHEIDVALELEQHEEGVPQLLWHRARLLRTVGKQSEAIETARRSLLMAQAVAPDYFGERIRRLAEMGYWQPPQSFPNTWEVALSDAVAACMADESCF